MDQVVVEDGTEGLGVMLAELIRGNLAADPARARLIDGARGRVNLTVRDAEVRVGIRFDGRTVRVGAALPMADLTIATDAETLMELTSVPLRFGMPDSLTPKGRAIAGKMMRGDLRVEGLPRQLPLMIRLQRLFTVT